MSTRQRFHQSPPGETRAPPSGVRRRNSLRNVACPVSLSSEPEAGRRFLTRRLMARPVPLFFNEELCVTTSRDEGGWSCSIPELAALARGGTESEALALLEVALREEVHQLLRTPSHELVVEQRERKGLLLFNIDVVTSRISKSVGDHTSVLGQVEMDAAGQRWFQAVGSRGGRYAFDPRLEGAIPEDGFLRMARICTDEVGEPVGPVVGLGPALNDDPDKTRAEWQRLLDADG